MTNSKSNVFPSPPEECYIHLCFFYRHTDCQTKKRAGNLQCVMVFTYACKLCVYSCNFAGA